MPSDFVSGRRRRVEAVLDTVEALIARLNSGEILPNRQLAAAVEFFRDFEESARLDPDARRDPQAPHVPCREQAGSQLIAVERALESLERGEAGAAGAFVVSAREYVRNLREYLQHEAPPNPRDPSQG